MKKIDLLVMATAGLENHEAFKLDIWRCENAFDMCGLCQIKAERWLQILEAMTEHEVREYVRTKYRPGCLNPFDERT